MLKYIFFLLAMTSVVSSLHATELKSIDELKEEFYNLKPYQRINLIKIFQRARKDDLSWTAVGISWEESEFGRFQISIPNRWSLDCGIFQNNTKTVLKRKGLKNNLYNRTGMCTILNTNPEKAYEEFVNEIRFWQRVKGENNWNEIWKSYNAGYTGGGKNYSKMIARRIRVLKELMPELARIPQYNFGELYIRRVSDSI
jgi:hypothetical protein